MRLTPQEFARWCQKNAAGLPEAAERAEKESAKLAKQTARGLSQGPNSLAQLAAMGHPYAAAHPAPPDDPAIINEQTGRFEAAFAVVGPLTSGAGEVRTAVENATPYARFLYYGTRLMIRRPLMERVGERISPARRQRLEASIWRLLSRRQ